MCKFGELYYADLPLLLGSQVQQGIRPVLIVSNDLNNFHSPIVNVIPLTASETKKRLPTHVAISGYGLKRSSIILAEQIISLDQSRLLGKIGAVLDIKMRSAIQNAMMIQLNMVS